MNKKNKVLISLLLAGTSLNSMATTPPNILVVVCEDISPYLGCYGDKVAVTPYLDQFSKTAVLHTNMYTCVGVSAPSRYSLITGRHSSADGANYMRSDYFNKEFGVVTPDEVKCYTEFMRSKGYYCTNNAKTDYQFPAPVSAWDEQGNKAHWKNAPKDRPFFSIFNLNITHESYIWKNTAKPLVVSPDKVILPPYYPDTDTVRHDHAVLYSNIAEMDKQFHALIEELEKSDRAKNTIVIFYSDNGGPLPRSKRELMDSGTHVPFMIRFPNGKWAGVKNQSFNMFVDIPATILSLAGVQPPAYMHGQAMYGTYKSSKERKYVFGATDRFDEQVEKRASIRSDRYLYIRNYMPEQSVYRPVEFRLSMPMMREMLDMFKKGKLNDAQKRWFEAPTASEELYDCEKDPHQIKNLVSDSKYRKVLNEMRKAYRKEWIEPFNKEWETYPEKYFVDKMWPGGVKPQSETPRLNLCNGHVKVENDLSRYSAIYQINGMGINGKKNHWMLYNEPIELKKGDKLTIRLERIGYKPSSVVEYVL